MTREDLADRRGLDRDVYQPAEDSTLLAEAAVDDVTDVDRVLEVGTGAGWVAEHVARETGARVVASDLNPHACRQARDRASRFGTERDEASGFDVVTADLVSSFADDAFDVVLFNPPYLPTDPDNDWGDWMERALSGGESGREVIDPFVEQVGRVLAPRGRVLLLVSSLTGYDEVRSHARDCGFTVEDVRQESFPFETLSILRLTQDNN